MLVQKIKNFSFNFFFTKKALSLILLAFSVLYFKNLNLFHLRLTPEPKKILNSLHTPPEKETTKTPPRKKGLKNIAYKPEKNLTPLEKEKYNTFFKTNKKNLLLFEEKEKNNNLKINGYKKKLNDHLMTSARIAINRASKMEQQLFAKFAKKIAFFLEINKQGRIKNFILTESSGLDEMDSFFQEIIHSAVPFPFIPDHLGIDSIVFSNNQI